MLDIDRSKRLASQADETLRGIHSILLDAPWLLPLVLEAINNPNWEARARAGLVFLLGYLAPDAAHQFLVQLLENDHASELHSAAINALAQHRGKRPTNPRLTYYALGGSHTHMSVDRALVDSETISALIRYLHRSPDVAPSKRMVVFWLSEVTDIGKPLPQLRTALLDLYAKARSPAERAEVADYLLHFFGVPEESVMAAFRKDLDASMADAAEFLRIVPSLGPKSARPYIDRVLKDRPSEEAVTAAMRILLQSSAYSPAERKRILTNHALDTSQAVSEVAIRQFVANGPLLGMVTPADITTLYSALTDDFRRRVFLLSLQPWMVEPFVHELENASLDLEVRKQLVDKTRFSLALSSVRPLPQADRERLIELLNQVHKRGRLAPEIAKVLSETLTDATVPRNR